MHIAVCVTGQSTCERLIHEGAALRRGNEDELYVLHVAKKGAQLLGDQSEADALEYLFKISHQYGANMVMLRADNTADAIIRFVQKNAAAGARGQAARMGSGGRAEAAPARH